MVIKRLVSTGLIDSHTGDVDTYAALTKIKQLEESSSLIESLKSLNKNSKCLNSSRSPVLTRTGPYGYIPGKYDPSMFQEALIPFYLRIGNFK